MSDLAISVIPMTIGIYGWVKNFKHGSRNKCGMTYCVIPDLPAPYTMVVQGFRDPCLVDLKALGLSKKYGLLTPTWIPIFIGMTLFCNP